LQDIFDIIESQQEPSYQNLLNWQEGLDGVFENLCKGRYGREEIRQSRDFLQSLKLSDKDQYARSMPLAGPPTPHPVRTAASDVPMD
jgi:hypothetical protein